MCTHIDVTITEEKEAMNLRESKDMRVDGGRKERGRNNTIIF